MNCSDDVINHIICGDCLEVLKDIPDNCIDAIVTDPPAGIEFMGKEWDSFKKNSRSKGWACQGKIGGDGFGGFGKKLRPAFCSQKNQDLLAFQDFIYQVFSEAIRVLKPGGHILVWAIPRTSHHTAMGIERAGFEIRDKVYFVFGSGFPKSLNISKAIEATEKYGKSGTKTLKQIEQDGNGEKYILNGRNNGILGEKKVWERKTYIPKGIAKQYEGWGTALKPAVEEWILARKPISEKTVAHNVLKWGTGGLNIDECRIGNDEVIAHHAPKGTFAGGEQGRGSDTDYDKNKGRFPSHLILDGSEEVEECFPNVGKSTGGRIGNKGSLLNMTGNNYQKGDPGYGDSGSASRFFQHCSITEEDLEFDRIFYGSKASKKERNMGGINNIHPTCKNLSLMRYLCRLITPKNGIVLDMFAGSGSTLIAAKQEGFKYIGIEKEQEYVKIAEARLKATPSPLL